MVHIIYHYFTPATCSTLWGPSGPSTAATAMASATPKLPTLPPVAVSMVMPCWASTDVTEVMIQKIGQQRIFGIKLGSSWPDLARIWQDAATLYFRIPDVIFTEIGIFWYLFLYGTWMTGHDWMLESAFRSMPSCPSKVAMTSVGGVGGVSALPAATTVHGWVYRFISISFSLSLYAYSIRCPDVLYSLFIRHLLTLRCYPRQPLGALQLAWPRSLAMAVMAL